MNVFVAQTNIKWIFCPPLFDKLAALFPLYCARRTFYPCHPLIGDDGENMNVAIFFIFYTFWTFWTCQKPVIEYTNTTTYANSKLTPVLHHQDCEERVPLEAHGIAKSACHEQPLIRR